MILETLAELKLISECADRNHDARLAAELSEAERIREEAKKMTIKRRRRKHEN